MKRNIDSRYKQENEYGSSNISNDSKKKRACLMCGKMFNSKSKGNRRCQRCSTVVKIQNAENMSSHIYKLPNNYKQETDTYFQMVRING